MLIHGGRGTQQTLVQACPHHNIASLVHSRHANTHAQAATCSAGTLQVHEQTSHVCIAT